MDITIFCTYLKGLIKESWHWACSEKASNFGSLLQGIGAIGLFIAGSKASDTFAEEVSKKRLEKKSESAGNALIKLSALEAAFYDWYASIRACANESDLIECEKKRAEIFAYLDIIEKDGKFLDKAILKPIKEISDYINDKQYSLRVRYFDNHTPENKKKAKVDLSEINTEPVEQWINDIREKLKAVEFLETNSK